MVSCLPTDTIKNVGQSFLCTLSWWFKVRRNPMQVSGWVIRRNLGRNSITNWNWVKTYNNHYVKHCRLLYKVPLVNTLFQRSFWFPIVVCLFVFNKYCTGEENCLLLLLRKTNPLIILMMSMLGVQYFWPQSRKLQSGTDSNTNLY